MAPFSPDLLERKRALRREMGQRREALTDGARRASAQAASARLLALPELAAVGGRTVAGYVAVRGELDPAAALAGAAAAGAEVVLPRVSATPPRLRFHRMAPGAALVPGSFGISEPEPDAPELPVSAIDVMIVPGLAFDEQARRLGFGGGYYDGALAGARSAGRPMLIGFAYEFQIVGDVPAGPDDMPVDLVVTDARVIRREARG